jgi:hypothetical protein
MGDTEEFTQGGMDPPLAWLGAMIRMANKNNNAPATGTEKAR